MEDLKDILERRFKVFSYYNQIYGHESDTQRVLKLLRRVAKGFIFVQVKRSEYPVFSLTKVIRLLHLHNLFGI